ncbi:MAG: hypothetical protein ACLS6G_05185 [Christensenellales bacterium]
MLTVAPDVLGQVIAAQVRAPKRAKVPARWPTRRTWELTTAAPEKPSATAATR